jgi:hypothetical protein
MTNRRSYIINLTLPLLAAAAMGSIALNNSHTMTLEGCPATAPHCAPASAQGPANTPHFTPADRKVEGRVCDSSTHNLRPKLVVNNRNDRRILAFDQVPTDGQHWVIGSC